jgi:hypothetical protein
MSGMSGSMMDMQYVHIVDHAFDGVTDFSCSSALH